jgi:ABC-type sugar transport system permease subunit
MWGLYLTAQVVRFVSSVFVSIIVGVVVSTLLAALAWRSGYDPELVFNVAGVLATLLAFVGCWRLEMKR